MVLPIQSLVCSNCTGLTSLPDNLYSLRYLTCRGCRTLTSLPDTCTSRWKPDCSFCPWLPHYESADICLSRNLEKLCRLQAWIRRHLTYRRFQRWIRSEGFAMWFYSPEQAGGRISKRHIQKVTGCIANFSVDFSVDLSTDFSDDLSVDLTRSRSNSSTNVSTSVSTDFIPSKRAAENPVKQSTKKYRRINY